MTERDGDMTKPGPRRVTVEDAARVLGLSESAIRKRIERNTLRSVRENGTRYVLLDGDMTGHDTDTTRHANDTTTDMSTSLIGAKDETIGELRDRIAQLSRIIENRDEELRREREARIEEKRRHDTIVLRMAERIPELPPASPAPPGPRESPQTVDEDAEGSEPRPTAGGAQEPAERRSWWRSLLGG